MASKNRNQNLSNMKYEIANELGVNLKQGYKVTLQPRKLVMWAVIW